MSDLIERQAVMDGLEKYHNTDMNIDGLTYAYDLVCKLPPVSTEKTGRWITQWNPAHQKEYYYCSECREEYSYDGETGIKMNNYKYCPNCGAKMLPQP